MKFKNIKIIIITFLIGLIRVAINEHRTHSGHQSAQSICSAERHIITWSMIERIENIDMTSDNKPWSKNIQLMSKHICRIFFLCLVRKNEEITWQLVLFGYSCSFFGKHRHNFDLPKMAWPSISANQNHSYLERLQEEPKTDRKESNIVFLPIVSLETIIFSIWK